MEPEDRLFMHDLCRLPDDAVLETPWPKPMLFGAPANISSPERNGRSA
ncbi:MAG: hypothetical protein LKE27_08975 [Atopobiaceae bacterium]|nr:hypothetical protein [Atopobiaceae bacterium]